VPRFTRARGGLAGVLTAVTLAALTGCSLIPDVSMSPGVTPPKSSASASSAHRTTAPVPAAVKERVRPPGELDTGTVTHTLPAGDRTVVVDYWTDEAAVDWTAEDTKNIQVSAHLEDDKSKLTVLVTRFVATADDGTVRTVVVEDRGEFAINPPFSYGSVLSLLPSAEDADQITLYVQFELLVETERASDRYYRQTVLDSLVLPLTKENKK
jgi:hypothetical protein